ncbi:16S rRNA (cytosine(1402)-N(4))-methyltransferase RsmH [Quadrisphaera oryzae]|uniref:16S rRNA (cytosine(1402)-N(4))-methyltransferase RsmH n=1 Tax=Quadrisphaera TaxID=317661 RepID=UPI00351C4ADE
MDDALPAPDPAEREHRSPGERHVPVLLDRCVDLLAPALQPRPDGTAPVVVDTTLGMGGHSEALLERLPAARLVAIDRDPQALAIAGARLERFGERATLVRAVYDELPDVLADLRVREVHGVLMDLGVSSLQLDEVDRGFSYARDAPLDMRMDPTSGLTAADVLNTYDARDLSRVLHVYGEEKFARRIADNVVRERAREPFSGTLRLVDLVRDSIPAPARRTGGNPAKRTFQALRIEVNRELDALRGAVPAALDALAVGGRLVVMSYQSLEDRIVKQTLAVATTSTAPPGLPFEPPEHAPRFQLLTRGAERADEAELAANPRSAPVRLRAAERVRPGRVPAPGGRA